MSLKAFVIDTAKVAPLALAKLLWRHAPDIVQFCMLVIAVRCDDEPPPTINSQTYADIFFEPLP